MGRVVAWNAALLAVGLIVLELVFGGWLDAFRSPGLWRLSLYRDVRWQLPVSGLYKGPATITFRRDSYGFRGSYGTPPDIDILTMGGSTTEERMVGEGETWSDQLSACLAAHGHAAHVANAGVAGQSTVGMLADFDLWLPYVPGLHPRTVLAYVGINDRAVDEQKRFDDLRSYNESDNSLMLERIKQNSAIYALVRAVAGNIKSHSGGVAYGGNAAAGVASDVIDAQFRATAGSRIEKGSAEYRAQLAAAESRLAGGLEGYTERLNHIVDRIQALGAEPVLLTQSDGSYRQDDRFVWGSLHSYFTLRAYNEATLGVCSRRNVRCIDFDDQSRFADGDFFDWIHVTPSGSKKVADVVCKNLLAGK